MTIDPSSSTTPDDNDEQFQLALIKVREEFHVITGGKTDMSLREAIEIREYIRKRTDLEKADDDLTPEQKAWKIVFHGMDKELSEKFGNEEKEKIDSALLKMAKLDLISENVNQLLLLGRQIEELLLHQHACFDVHFDDNSTYRMIDEKMVAEMLAESTPKSKRIEIANDILQVVDKYKQIIIKPLFEDQDKIHELLSRFRVLYEQTPFTVANKDERIKQIESLYKEWLLLTEDLHQARLKAITAVKTMVELDKLIPNHIIKHNGDNTVTIPSEDLAQPSATAQVFLKEAFTKEEEISKKRYPLSIESFSEPNSYIKVNQEEDRKASKEENKKVNPLQGKAWFRLLKVIYIVACVLAAVVSIGLLSTGSEGALVVVGILVLLFILIPKGFYYVVLGKTSWK